MKPKEFLKQHGSDFPGIGFTEKEWPCIYKWMEEYKEFTTRSLIEE